MRRSHLDSGEHKWQTQKTETQTRMDMKSTRLDSGTGTQRFRSPPTLAAQALDRAPPLRVMKSHHMRRKGEIMNCVE